LKPIVLIPMAGLGSRFQKEGYKVPKQLIAVGDKQLIDISLDCLEYTGCKMIFIVRDEQVYNHHMDVILRQKFGSDVEIIVLDRLTEGSVCSCLYAEHLIDNDAPLVIHTLDVEFAPKFDVNTLSDLDADGKILTFKSNSSNYSYVKTDESGVAVATAEKKPISNQACVGVYCFKRGSDFVRLAKEMIAADMRTNNEFYIAPLYNLFIDNSMKIVTQEVEKMHVFGTPDEYQFYKNNVYKHINRKPVALCCDHSGYIAKEKFKAILQEQGIEYIDFGTTVNKDCDYADYISQAVRSMRENECNYAFGFCRSGQGVNICANKYKGIRSALIYNDYAMEMAIRHNCANFFSIPAKDITTEQLTRYLHIAQTNTFDGGRHQIRIQNLES